MTLEFRTCRMQNFQRLLLLDDCCALTQNISFPEYMIQRCIYDSIKHLWWRFSLKLETTKSCYIFLPKDFVIDVLQGPPKMKFSLKISSFFVQWNTPLPSNENIYNQNYWRQNSDFWMLSYVLFIFRFLEIEQLHQMVSC